MTGCFLCHITTPKQCNNTNHTDRNVPNQSRQNSEEATEDENNWNAFNQQLPNSSISQPECTVTVKTLQIIYIDAITWTT